MFKLPLISTLIEINLIQITLIEKGDALSLVLSKGIIMKPCAVYG